MLDAVNQLSGINKNLAALIGALVVSDVNLLSAINSNLSDLVTAFTNAFPLSAYKGSFTCAAAASTTVTDANTQAASAILLFPTNAAAATLMAGASSLYVSAKTADTSFAVSTADAGNAAGTETFDYIIVNVG